MQLPHTYFRLLTGVLAVAGLSAAAPLQAQNRDREIYPVYSDTSMIGLRILQRPRDTVFGGANTERAYDIIQTSTSEYIIAGKTSTRSEGGEDVLILKVDTAFREVFSRSFGNQSNDGAYAVLETRDGGYVAAGYGTPAHNGGYGGTDALLLKTDEQGVPIWSRYFGTDQNDVFRDILQLEDGSFVVTGAKNYRGWIGRIDREGRDFLWERVLPTTDTSEGMSLIYTRDRHIAVAGYFETPGRSLDSVFLIKLSTDNDLIFHQKFRYHDQGNPSEKQFKRSRDDKMQILELNDGAFAITGHVSSDTYREDMYLLIAEPDGKLRFERPYGGIGSDLAHAITEIWEDNSLILGGATMSHIPKAQSYNLWLRKIDPITGDSRWKKNAREDRGNARNDACNALLINHKGYLIAAGYSERPGRKEDVWLVQFDNLPATDSVTAAALLVSEPELYEWEQNREINPGERCYLGFSITNKGAAPVRNLYAKIQHRNGRAGIRFPSQVLIPPIPPGQQQQISIPLKGADSLAQDQHLFEITIHQSPNLSLHRMQAQVRSNKRPEADLRFSQAQFSTPRLDQVAKQGDKIRFQVKLENAGNQTATGVAARFFLSGGIPLQGAPAGQEDILPYSGQTIDLAFSIPWNYTQDTISLYYAADDERLQNSAGGRYTILLDEPVLSIPDSLRYPGARAVFWRPETRLLADSVLYEKNATLKAAILSDQPVSIQQLTLWRNRSDSIPMSRFGRLVLIQSENGQYLYQLRLPMALVLGQNDLELHFTHENGTTISSLLPLRFEARRPKLILYSIGVPQQKEGPAYYVQNAGDFYNFALKNDERNYFQSRNAHLIADTVQTQFYNLRRLFFEIRNQASQGQYGPEDVLVVYVSAQATDKVKGTFKIKASDYDGVEVETSAVDFEDFFLYFLDDTLIRCHTLLIMDVFEENENAEAQEQETTEEITLSAHFVEFQHKLNRMNILMSCSPGEYGHTAPEWSNSALMEAISTLADPESRAQCDSNLDREITLTELYAFLQQKTPAFTNERWKKSQTPLLLKGASSPGDFTLFAY